MGIGGGGGGGGGGGLPCDELTSHPGNDDNGNLHLNRNCLIIDIHVISVNIIIQRLIRKLKL